MKIKLYTAVCQDKKGNCFTVNGSTRRNYDEAIIAAQKHNSLKRCDAQIIRMNIEEVWEDELDRNPY